MPKGIYKHKPMPSEVRAKISKTTKGRIPLNFYSVIFGKRKGSFHTEESKQKMMQANFGKRYSPETEFKKGITPWNNGKQTKESTCLLISLANRGKRYSPLTEFKKGMRPWNKIGDGISSLTNQIRTCMEYIKWRASVFKRDGYMCMLCGYNKGGILQADHFPVPFYKIIKGNKIGMLQEALKCEELWNVNNGRTLCKPCHLVETKKILWQ